jgi:hypothetical protein
MASIDLTLPCSPTRSLSDAFQHGLIGWWAVDADLGDEEHTLRFDKNGRVVTMRFRVDHVDDQRVQWTCLENGNPVWPGTTLTWRLSDGHLHLEHAGFHEQESPPYQMTVDGWQHFMASLVSWLETGAGQPW